MSPVVNEEDNLKCGIIMPISAYGNRTAEFWEKVKQFVCEAIVEAGMEPVPVWEDKKNDIIHAKIISNIDKLPVAIGVIIEHNPNVMLECGMRLWRNLLILLLHGDGEKIPFDVGSIQGLLFPTNFDYFLLTQLKKDIVAKLSLMRSPDYRSFKSYYSIPAEVEAPDANAKIDFKGFVNEIRSGFNSLNNELRELRKIVDEPAVFPLSYAQIPSYGRQSAQALKYYQMGAVSSSGPTGGLETSTSIKPMPAESPMSNDSSIDADSSSPNVSS